MKAVCRARRRRGEGKATDRDFGQLLSRLFDLLHTRVTACVYVVYVRVRVIMHVCILYVCQPGERVS